jgi:hypothetical protein
MMGYPVEKKGSRYLYESVRHGSNGLCRQCGRHGPSSAPWLLKVLIGGPLVTSFRITNEKAKRELGRQPRYSTFKDGLPGVLKALEAGQEARSGEG